LPICIDSTSCEAHFFKGGAVLCWTNILRESWLTCFGKMSTLPATRLERWTEIPCSTLSTIRLSGELSVAGVCDEPRIESQIDATARQFPTVKRVKVFIGNQTLAAAIR